MTDQLPIIPASPLAEVDPASLNELFSRDPLKLSDQDIDKMVEIYRAQRLRWKQEEATGGPKKAAKIANNAETKKLSLDDLDIDI